MKISECKDKIKVGDWVRINEGSSIILVGSFEGEIGEIQKYGFYIWQNKKNGGFGNVLPSTKGYKYSWFITFDNPNEIEIINRPNGEVKDEPKGKIMSIVKDMFKSKEQKALNHFSITNGDGGLTSTGREELLDFIWETNKELRKEFVAKIIEAYKETK